MKAIEYGELKIDILHLDQIIEHKIAHHHIMYKRNKYYIRITKKS